MLTLPVTCGRAVVVVVAGVVVVVVVVVDGSIWQMSLAVTSSAHSISSAQQ